MSKKQTTEGAKYGTWGQIRTLNKGTRQIGITAVTWK